jgi:hypothetical protein
MSKRPSDRPQAAQFKMRHQAKHPLFMRHLNQGNGPLFLQEYQQEFGFFNGASLTAEIPL